MWGSLRLLNYSSCQPYVYYYFKDEFINQPPGPIARALVLSLSVCYHARLQDRKEYEDGVINSFTDPISLPNGAEQFRDEIRWYIIFKYDDNTVSEYNIVL